MENQLIKKEEKPQEVAKEKIQNLTQTTEFSKAIDQAKIHTITKASAEDQKFNDDFKKELKEAVLKSAQLEKEKQELEKRNIELQQDYILTKQELESQTQAVNKWNNKRERRQYHYDGLKDIMQFVHINNPMCVWLMYVLALIVSPIYLIYVLIISPLGTLLGGTKGSERPKVVKGAIYTVLLLTLIAVVVVGLYLAGHYWCGWW